MTPLESLNFFASKSYSTESTGTVGCSHICTDGLYNNELRIQHDTVVHMTHSCLQIQKGFSDSRTEVSYKFAAMDDFLRKEHGFHECVRQHLPRHWNKTPVFDSQFFGFPRGFWIHVLCFQCSSFLFKHPMDQECRETFECRNFGGVGQSLPMPIFPLIWRSFCLDNTQKLKQCKIWCNMMQRARPLYPKTLS